MIQEGQPFPPFQLQDQNGDTITNADLAGNQAIIYFYPKDDTPGCTAEACDFRDFSGKLVPRVVGVSPDSVASHRKFAEKYALGFTLLSDPDHALTDACGFWGEKEAYGRRTVGVLRSTVLLDADGIVRRVWHRVKPLGHVAQVLESLGASADR